MVRQHKEASTDWFSGKCTLFLAVVSLVASSSCQHDPDNVTLGELHPTEENMPIITDSRYVLREEGSETDTTWPFIGFSGQKEIAIGVNEGDDHEMVGMVEDMTISEVPCFMQKVSVEKCIYMIGAVLLGAELASRVKGRASFIS